MIITGKGIPTKYTQGNTGDIYVDTNTRKQYCCVFVVTIGTDKEYDWAETGELADDLHIPEEKVIDILEEPEESPVEVVGTNEVSQPYRNHSYTDYSKKNKKNKR